MKTTFSEGRMTAKEAWLYCRELCGLAGIDAPTLRTFKWYLQHADVIKSEMLPDPFGGSLRVHAISSEAVAAFVKKLTEEGTSKLPSEKGPEPLTSPAPEPEPKHEATKQTTQEFDRRTALEYLHRRVGKGCELNSTTFGFYLAYDIIPSHFEKRERVVQQGDLDAFIELAPTGIYANHLSYETDFDSKQDLDMRDAYAYYADVDPAPIALNTFRSLVAAGIIRPIRTANDPKAPILGFKRQEIAVFLAVRQRMMEDTRDLPMTKGFLTRKVTETVTPKPEGQGVVERVMQEVIERAEFELEAAKPQPEPSPRQAETPKPAPITEEQQQVPGRWATVTTAYEHYCKQFELVDKQREPHSFSWFRAKVYEGKLFVSRFELDPQRSGAANKVYFVDLDSVDAYLVTVASNLEKTMAKPSKKQLLPVALAYPYYTARCSDPLSKSQFSRLVAEGVVPEAVQQDGRWMITPEGIDAFLVQYPSGRTRPNKHSPARKEKRAERHTPKTVEPPQPERPPTLEIVVPVREPESRIRVESKLGRISVSLRNYPSAADIETALRLLTEQGFDVEVVP